MALRNAGCSRGLNVMSREIVHTCVSSHRGRLDVSGLRGRSVPAAAAVGLGVLGDGRAVGVADRDRGGVPGDGDLFAFALVAGVELVGEDADVAAL